MDIKSKNATTWNFEGPALKIEKTSFLTVDRSNHCFLFPAPHVHRQDIVSSVVTARLLAEPAPQSQRIRIFQACLHSAQVEI